MCKGKNKKTEFYSIYVHMCEDVCMYMCMYVCKYIYIYIYMYDVCFFVYLFVCFVYVFCFGLQQFICFVVEFVVVAVVVDRLCVSMPYDWIPEKLSKIGPKEVEPTQNSNCVSVSSHQTRSPSPFPKTLTKLICVHWRPSLLFRWKS